MLVTAGHVLSGENADTGEVLDRQWCRRPDFVKVYLPCGGNGTYAADIRSVSLFSDGDEQQCPLWLKHPDGRRVDVAALPLGGGTPLGLASTLLAPFTPPLMLDDLVQSGKPEWPGEPVPLRVMDRVHIVGFPLGVQGSWQAGIWTAGYVASEPSMRWDNRPAMLIDARSRRGQSGAPVIRIVSAANPVLMDDHDALRPGYYGHELIGVYAGRTDNNSDLGRVFTRDASQEHRRAGRGAGPPARTTRHLGLGE